MDWERVIKSLRDEALDHKQRHAKDGEKKNLEFAILFLTLANALEAGLEEQ